MPTVSSLLSKLGVTPSDLSACSTLDEEFAQMKRAWFKLALRLHPDKQGGDAASFREVQSAFEVLRERFESGRTTSFAT
jgi:hypothetical protein